MIEQNEKYFIELNNQIINIKNEKMINKYINLFLLEFRENDNISFIVKLKSSLELFLYVIKKIKKINLKNLIKIVNFCFELNYFIDGIYFNQKIIKIDNNYNLINNLENFIDIPFYNLTFKEIVDYFWENFVLIQELLIINNNLLELKLIADSVFEIINFSNSYNIFKEENNIIINFDLDIMPVFMINYIFNKKPDNVNKNFIFRINKNILVSKTGFLENLNFRIIEKKDAIIIVIIDDSDYKQEIKEQLCNLCFKYGGENYIIDFLFDKSVYIDVINFNQLVEYLKLKLNLLENNYFKNYVFNKSVYHRLNCVYGKSKNLAYLSQCEFDITVKNLYKFGVYPCYLIFYNVSDYLKIIDLIKIFEKDIFEYTGYGICNHQLFVDLIVYDYNLFRIISNKIYVQYPFEIRSYSLLSKKYDLHNHINLLFS